MKIFLTGHQAFEKHFRIKFDEPVVKIHTNGFVSVSVDWHAKQGCIDFWRFKYPDLTHKMFGGDAIHKRKRYFIQSAAFHFPDLETDTESTIKIDFTALKMTSWFDVCVGTATEQEFYEQEYDYVFFEKTKYGLICWFAPRGWEDWNNTKDFEQ
jgi:hypothetical protein